MSNELGEGLSDYFKKGKPSYIASFKTSQNGREIENSSSHDDYPSAVKAAGEKGFVTHNWPGQRSHGAILYRAGKHMKLKEALEQKRFPEFETAKDMKTLAPEKKKEHNKFVYSKPYKSLSQKQRRVVPANEEIDNILEDFLTEVHKKAYLQDPENRKSMASYLKNARSQMDSKARSNEYLDAMGDLASDPSNKENMAAVMHIKNAWNRENKRGSNVHIDSPVLKPKVITKSKVKTASISPMPSRPTMRMSMTAESVELENIVDSFLEDTTTGNIASLPLGFKKVGMLANGNSEVVNPGGVYATKMEKKKKKYHNLTRIVASMGGV